MADTALPEFDKFWNYDDPAGTEVKFREILPQAEASGNRGYHAELLTQIARTHSLRRQFDQAHALLDQVHQMIGEEHSRAQVRYQLERGRSCNSAGRKDEARAQFLAAWALASSLGEESLAIDAAHMMAIVEPPENQLEWNLRALAAAESAKDPRARNWLGALYNNIGWTYHDLGQYEQALELFEKGLEWRTKKGEARPTQIAKWTVARAKRSLGRTQEALAGQQALLEEIESSGGEQDGYVFEEIGECLLTLGRAEEAKPYFAKAHAMLSRDTWLAENEAPRLSRLKELGGI
ncbi:tetratricopeptide repeat protein [Candidatus Poribacteria bacterium]|nr:tetratricopeptide repeat protein [Candidatus Poribacteria bacterium]